MHPPQYYPHPPQPLQYYPHPPQCQFMYPPMFLQPPVQSYYQQSISAHPQYQTQTLSTEDIVKLIVYYVQEFMNQKDKQTKSAHSEGVQSPSNISDSTRTSSPHITPVHIPTGCSTPKRSAKDRHLTKNTKLVGFTLSAKETNDYYNQKILDAYLGNIFNYAKPSRGHESTRVYFKQASMFEGVDHLGNRFQDRIAPDLALTPNSHELSFNHTDPHNISWKDIVLIMQDTLDWCERLFPNQYCIIQISGEYLIANEEEESSERGLLDSSGCGIFKYIPITNYDNVVRLDEIREQQAAPPKLHLRTAQNEDEEDEEEPKEYPSADVNNLINNQDRELFYSYTKEANRLLNTPEKFTFNNVLEGYDSDTTRLTFDSNITTGRMHVLITVATKST